VNFAIRIIPQYHHFPSLQKNINLHVAEDNRDLQRKLADKSSSPSDSGRGGEETLGKMFIKTLLHEYVSPTTHPEKKTEIEFMMFSAVGLKRTEEGKVVDV